MHLGISIRKLIRMKIEQKILLSIRNDRGFLGYDQ